MQNIVRNWLDKNKIIYDEVIFSDNKADVCKELNISVMIEDRPENVVSVSSVVPVLCYDQPYNEKLSNAIGTLKDTMVEISQSVKDSNRINNEITKTIEELNKKITSVEIRISEIDDKSKLDIVLWLKNNWFGIVGILGIIYTIIKTII